jgi:alpha-tubulin suppressor-like RCC1 family protein
MDRGAAVWFAHRMTSSFFPRNMGIVALISLTSCGTTVQFGGGGTSTEPAPDGGTPTEPERDGGTPTEPAPDGGPPIFPGAGLRILAGGDNTCVVSAAGHVACWGSSETGQLGLGDFVDHRTPAWIPGLDGVVDLAIGDFSMCASRIDGSVLCWGMNYYGELGVNTNACPGLGYPCSTVPVATGVQGAGLLGAGVHRFCAVLSPDGGLECWGSGEAWAAPGYHALSAAGGDGHMCVRFAPGPGQDPTRNVVCAGDNSTGQLGAGAMFDKEPGPIANGVSGGFVELAAGLSFTCGVNAASELFCWGNNQFGALGVGVSDNSDFPESCPGNGACARNPVRVTGLPPIAHVAAHFFQTCALTTAGDVYCWGAPSHTSPASASACWSASPECAPTPQLVPGVAQATSIGVGYGHACALTASGEISCWGLDTHGQLGRGNGPSFEATPVAVQLPPEPL